LIAARVLWLGQNPAVFVHQLGNGGLLLFAFFMISDPMTIPNRRSMRIVYALCVAAAAFAWQFVLFKPNALVWALFLCAPLVPVFDWLAPGERFRWGVAASDNSSPFKGKAGHGKTRETSPPLPL
jgi:Na+-transporting NADH:ubiquinone oxidoreductase subunit NqrB